MSSRLKLQSKLEEFIGNKNVYYQPPDNKQMSYPAIRYQIKKRDVKRANDHAYISRTCYEVIVISKRPDNDAINKLFETPFCVHDRHYVADNLNHDVFTLYF